MSEYQEPTFDVDFIRSLLVNSVKVQAQDYVCGDTNMFVLKGTGSVAKRTIILRHFDGQLEFNLGISIAKRLGCLGEALSWLEKNRFFKDGGYFESENNKATTK